jgi:hypothetical protein
MYVGLSIALMGAAAGPVFGLPHTANFLIGSLAAGVGVRLMLNPKSGFRLTGTMIEVFGGGSHRLIPLRQIASVLVSGRRQGETLCVLRLRDGTEIDLPAVARLRSQDLVRQFGDRGVQVLV